MRSEGIWKSAGKACIFFLAACTGFAGLSRALFAQDAGRIAVSGVLDSSVTMGAGAGDTSRFYYGLEEYANLRLQARLRDRAIFYGAFNFIAAAGYPAQSASDWGLYQEQEGLAPSAYVSGEHYIAGMELERLYFRVNGESLDFDGGLMRIPFGYGQVWGSSDFLNPRNPLLPDSRPRGVLGAGLAWYLPDETKLFFFGAAPKNPFAVDGSGGLGGISAERHWEKFSVQALYAAESPRPGSAQGLHRAGLSVKADMILGWVLDMLYTANPEAGASVDGLSAGAGFDYSFYEGKFIALAEYLYNGAASSTSINSGNVLGLSNENYILTSLSYMLNDYTTLTASLVSAFDDLSFTPMLSAEHDLFQGLTLSLSAQMPMDSDLFRGDGNRGELGPLPPGSSAGSYFNLNAKVKLRF
ncbi:MAG: hypothetical protein LBR96_02815 [Treponema sp.]|jgi:hypothetical protein|nr:hypothetical protein [Treponema sp.]